MILYLGDKELFDFICSIHPDISMEISFEEADKMIISEYSHNAVSLIRSAAEKGKPTLCVLNGYQSMTEAFGAQCQTLENCPEGKQELAVIDTSTALHKGLGHVISICRGIPSAIIEETMPPTLDCIARAETGEIIALKKNVAGSSNDLYALNYYLNSALTQHGEIIIQNFLNL